MIVGNHILMHLLVYPYGSMIVVPLLMKDSEHYNHYIYATQIEQLCINKNLQETLSDNNRSELQRSGLD